MLRKEWPEKTSDEIIKRELLRAVLTVALEAIVAEMM
jgi:hypothetical protein